MADNQIEIKIKVQAEELKTALDEASGVVQKSMEKISGDFELGFGQFKQASEKSLTESLGLIRGGMSQIASGISENLKTLSPHVAETMGELKAVMQGVFDEISEPVLRRLGDLAQKTGDRAGEINTVIRAKLSELKAGAAEKMQEFSGVIGEKLGHASVVAGVAGAMIAAALESKARKAAEGAADEMGKFAEYASGKISSGKAKIGEQLDKVGDLFEKHTKPWVEAISSKFDGVGEWIQGSLSKVTPHVSSAMSGIGGAVSGGLSRIASGIPGVVTALVGFSQKVGEAFQKAREFADVTAKLNNEAVSLGAKLGISATQAATLKLKLDQVGVSGDQYSKAFLHFSEAVRKNGDELKSMGVDVEKAKQGGTSLEEAFLAATTKINDFKPGLDQSKASMAMFGTETETVVKMQDMLAINTEDVLAKQRALGIEVGERSVEQTKKYDDAMGNLGLVLKAFQSTIGDALMPILTKLAEWFADIAPAAIVVLRGVVGGFAAMFWGFKESVTIAWEAICAVFNTSVGVIKSAAEFAWRALHLDFSGAVKAWQDGSKEIAAKVKGNMNTVVSSAEEAQKSLLALFDKSQKAADAPKSGSKEYGNPSGASSSPGGAPASKMSQYEKELEEERKKFTLSVAQEREYWKSKLAEAAKGSADYKAIQDKLKGLKGGGGSVGNPKSESKMGEYEGELHSQRLDYKKNNKQHEMEVADEIAYWTAIKDAAATNSSDVAKIDLKLKELRDKARDEEIKKAISTGQAAIDETLRTKQQELDLEKEDIRKRRALGEIEADDEIQLLKALEQKKYEEERRALDARRNLLIQQGQDAQNEQIKLADLDSKYKLAMRKSDNDLLIERLNKFKQMTQPIQQAFDSSLKGMLQGTMTFKQAMGNMGKALKDSAINAATDIVKNWIQTETAKTAASVLGAATRTTAEKTAASESVLATAWAAGKNILAAAWEAAANVYKAIASIPYVGPFMAPAMAIGAATVIGGYVGRIASAAGGYDIPAGVNPLTQLHEKEMVLPAKHADVIRSLSEGGTGGGAQPVNVNISAVDARSVKRLFMDHGGALTDSIRAQARNFRTV
ncbi:MAG: hypothetical protein AB1400_08820 [Pseudomonadota bacterium]